MDAGRTSARTDRWHCIGMYNSGQMPYQVKTIIHRRTLQARGMNGRRLKYLSSIRECISGANEMLEWRALQISAFSTDRHTDMAYIPEPERDRYERVCPLSSPLRRVAAELLGIMDRPAQRAHRDQVSSPCDVSSRAMATWPPWIREADAKTQRLRLHAILESSPPDVPLLLLSVLLPEPNRHHGMLNRPS